MQLRRSRLRQENRENQFKESWQDEYLKWICAFANTEGGFSGVEVSKLILFSQGRTWDSIPVPGLFTKKLDSEAVDQLYLEIWNAVNGNCNLGCEFLPQNILTDDCLRRSMAAFTNAQYDEEKHTNILQDRG